MTVPRKILIIDDDDDDRSMFVEALREVDPSVSCFAVYGGIEAFEWLEGCGTLPDLIFLDLNMPRMNGREFLEKRRRNDRFKAIPVIIYSTSRRTEDVQATLALGAVEFLTKPDMFRDICDTLKEVLSRKWD